LFFVVLRHLGGAPLFPPVTRGVIRRGVRRKSLVPVLSDCGSYQGDCGPKNEEKFSHRSLLSLAPMYRPRHAIAKLLGWRSKRSERRTRNRLKLDDFSDNATACAAFKLADVGIQLSRMEAPKHHRAPAFSADRYNLFLDRSLLSVCHSTSCLRPPSHRAIKSINFLLRRKFSIPRHRRLNGSWMGGIDVAPFKVRDDGTRSRL
jgi:hypothetical protein